jgi:hypothetical protein
MWAALRIEMLAFAALGAFALWMRLKYGSNFFVDVDKFVNEIVDDFHARSVAKMAFFVIFGAILSTMMVEPTTERQALAAGMAWTALLGNFATRGARKGRTGGNAT